VMHMSQLLALKKPTTLKLDSKKKLTRKS